MIDFPDSGEVIAFAIKDDHSGVFLIHFFVLEVPECALIGGVFIFFKELLCLVVGLITCSA